MQSSRIASLLFLCLSFLIATHPAYAQTTPSPSAPVKTEPPHQTNAPAAATATGPGQQPAAALPEPKTPAEFFARARQLSDLEASGIPFHLKAIFVASGDAEFKGNGTYEEWWLSKDIWREETTLGRYRWVRIKNGTKHAASATSDYMPLRVVQILRLRIFDPQFLSMTQSEWKVSPQAATTNSPATVADESPCNPKIKSILCIQQYEFGADGALHTYRYNDVTETYSDFQPFGKLLFPRKVVLAVRFKPMDTVTTVSLQPLAENDYKLFDVGAVPSLGTVPPLLIGAVPPRAIRAPKLAYSAALKKQKYRGKSEPTSAVMVECMIGTNGEIREPFIERSDGGKFDNTALEEVRTAVFKPAKVRGKPVQALALMLIYF